MSIDSSSRPAISVLVPVYNGAAYLETCIRSVLTQSCGDFELLIRDDGSSDESPSIIASFADPRIRLVPSTGRGGLFNNVNALLREARGDLIRVVCQDDELEPQCLEVETAFLAQNPGAGLCFSKAAFTDDDGVVVERAALNDCPAVMEPALSMQLFYYFGCLPGNLSTVCFRRESIERFGPFDTSFGVAADYEMWVRICRTQDLGVIHEHLVRVRRHEKQLSRANKSLLECMVQNRRIRDSIFDRLPITTRSRAVRYTRLRHDVLDVHHAIRRGIAGSYGDFRRVLEILGGPRFALGAMLWLVTVDNRIWRPKAPIVEGM